MITPDQELRQECLDQAIRSAMPGESREEILKRAEDYYKFIKNQEESK